MDDNLVHISNTPIFDKLVRELGYDPKCNGRRFSNLSNHLGQMSKVKPSGILPGSWIAKPVPQMAPPAPQGLNAELKVNFHPLDLEDQHIDYQQFLNDRVAEFNRKHPNAMGVVMETSEELDGTVTLLIRGHENKGVVLAKKPVFIPEQPAGETFVTRGEAVVLPPVFRTEFKTDPIPEELAERQLHLYKKHLVDGVIPTKLDQEPPDTNLKTASPEQTDESVNAASTDVQPRPQDAGPRPLWFVDEENADEE